MNSIAGYARVSSMGQDMQSQVLAIERAAALRGEKIGRWYREKASARTLNRPALDSLRADIRAGLVKRAYCLKIDRLSRSSVAQTYSLLEEVRKNGCELVAVADNLVLKPGTDDIVSDALIFGLALGARIERAAINDRIAAARERMKAEGRPWGRPPKLTARDHQRICALRDEGRTIREIAVAAKIARSTVAWVLSKKVLPVPPSSNPHLAHPKKPAAHPGR